MQYDHIVTVFEEEYQRLTAMCLYCGASAVADCGAEDAGLEIDLRHTPECLYGKSKAKRKES